MAQRTRQASQRKQQQLHHRHKQHQGAVSVTTSSLPPPAPLPSQQLQRIAPYGSRLKPTLLRMILPTPASGEPPANATAPAIPTTYDPGWPPLPMLPVLPVLPSVVSTPHLSEVSTMANNAAALTSVAVEALSSLSVAAFVVKNINKKKISNKKRIRLKTDRRREQCRTNQARYRNKQRDHEVELEEYVVTLRQEVQALEQHMQQLCARNSGVRSSSEASISVVQLPRPDEEHLFPMQLVKEYFRLFEHGFSFESDTTTDPRSQQQEQMAFLDSVMDPALQVGDFVGVDTLVGQWRKYSRYFDDLHLELVDAVAIEKASLGNDDGSDTSSAALSQHQMMIISTTARLTVTVTHETIWRVFPHLAQAPHLYDRLVGTRVSFDSVSEFEFEIGDDQAHTVRRLNCTVDFVKSLLGLLGNLMDVATVLEQARIVNDYYLRD